MWSPPSITLKWGPYSSPDPAEQLQVVQAVQAALGGPAGQPLVTLQLAVEKLKQAGVFNIDDVDAIVADLEAKAEEKKAEEEANKEVELEHSIQQIEAKAAATPKKPPPGKK